MHCIGVGMAQQNATDEPKEQTHSVLTCAVTTCGAYPDGNAVLKTDRGNEVQIPVCDDHVGEVCFDIQS